MLDKNLKKAELRRKLLAHRQAIEPEVRHSSNLIIAERVVAWWQQHKPHCLGVYIPMRGEPDLHAAYAQLHALGARLALPAVTAKAAPLSFLEWVPGDELSVDALGVPVPATGKLVQPDALLIPCVGFNAHGFRLGYGGGFYDRTLAAGKRPLAVGIAYACTEADFACSPHDVPMDLIITD